MANRLSMATMHSAQTLYRSGHTDWEIARLLGIDRDGQWLMSGGSMPQLAVQRPVRRLRTASRPG